MLPLEQRDFPEVGCSIAPGRTSESLVSSLLDSVIAESNIFLEHSPGRLQFQQFTSKCILLTL